MIMIMITTITLAIIPMLKLDPELSSMPILVLLIKTTEIGGEWPIIVFEPVVAIKDVVVLVALVVMIVVAAVDVVVVVLVLVVLVLVVLVIEMAAPRNFSGILIYRFNTY